MCEELNIWAKEKIVSELKVKGLSDIKVYAKQMSSFFMHFDDVFNHQQDFYKKYKNKLLLFLERRDIIFINMVKQ